MKKALDTEIEFLVKKNPDAEWADIAPAVKKNLVGKVATIMVAKEDGGRIKYSPLMQDGNAVVRAIKAEDIDRIGETVYNDIFGL